MVEAHVIAHLRESGFDAYAEPPASASSTGGAGFVTVERTGGQALHRNVERATVAVQFWAATSFEAAEGMGAVDAAMLRLPDSDGPVSSCRRNSLYRFPTEGHARYQGLYEITAYTTE